MTSGGAKVTKFFSGGKERILEIMNNPNTTEETANQHIAEIQAAIKQRKSETK